MISSEQEKEVLGHMRTCVYSAVALLSLLLVFALWAYLANSSWFLPIWGAFFGSFSASVNLLAIAWAFYVLVIKKGRRRILFWPVLTFLCLCILAYIYATHLPEQALGFAFGLTVPVILGGAIVFL
jgi:hypothetical protein